MKSSAKIRLTLLFYVILVIVLSLTPSSGYNVGQADKVGHFITYGGMATLALLSFDGIGPRSAALAGAVVIGATLELGQSFVPGRDMSMADGIVNALGVLSGASMFHFYGDVLRKWTRSILERQ